MYVFSAYSGVNSCSYKTHTMQSIRIKEEVNSDDDEDNKESQATFINNFEFKNEGDDSKNVNVVKKEEIVFGGSPKKLQIRPFAASLKEEVADDGSLADNETLKEPPPNIHTGK
jgi:hypothetical protein